MIFAVLWIAIALSPLILIALQFLQMDRAVFADAVAAADRALPVLLQTVGQAALSSLGAMVLGSCGCFGFLAWRWPQYKKWVERLALIPAFVPPIAVVTAVYDLGFAFGHLPSGFDAVVIIHVAMNMGWVAVALARVYESKAGSMMELATVEGARSWQFIRATFRLVRPDFELIAFMVFGICLLSFIVPLHFGGQTGMTVEVLLYQWLKTGKEPLVIIGWGLLQTLSLTLVGIWLFSKFRVHPQTWKTPHQLFSQTLGVLVVLLPTALLVGVCAFSLPKAIVALLNSAHDLPLGSWVVSSLLIGSIAGLFTLGLSLWASFVLPQRLLIGFLAAGVPMGAMVIVCGFISFTGPQSIATGMVMTSLGLTLLWTPFLIRWLLLGPLLAVQSQMEVARVLGASRLIVFWDILLPNIARPLFQVAGWSAGWAACDFSISAALLPTDQTLAIAIDNLLSLYRPELATACLWIVTLTAAICYGMFAGIGYGLYQKLSSPIR